MAEARGQQTDGEVVRPDGARSNVQFEPGSSINVSYDEGDDISPAIALPQNASGGHGTIAYRLSFTPSARNLSAAGVQHYGHEDQNPRIEGSNLKSRGSLDRVLRWTWEAYDTDPTFGPGDVRRDSISVTVTIRAEAAIRLGDTPQLEAVAGQSGFRQRLADASGGSGRFTYALDPFGGGLPLSALGLYFDAASNTVASSPRERVANLPNIYVFDHSASDGRNTVRRTVRIRVRRGSVLVGPLRMNHGAYSRTFTRGVRGTLYFVQRASGGQPPYEYVLTMPFTGDAAAFAASNAARITGVPTRTGSYTGVYTVWDSSTPRQSAFSAVNIAVVDPAVELDDTPLIRLTVGQTGFSQALAAATGGKGAFTYELDPASGSSLADLGLSYDAATNTLSTTAGGADIAGTHRFRHRATSTVGGDLVGGSAAASVTIEIIPAPTAAELDINHPGYRLSWAAGRRHRVDFAHRAVGGTPPYAYRLDMAFPVDAAAFDADEDRIIATPTRPWNYEGALTVTDSASPPATDSYPVRIRVARSGELPGAPGLSVDDVEERSARISASPSAGGTPTGYEYRIGSSGDFTLTSASSWAIERLSPGTVYTVQVRAIRVTPDAILSSGIASIQFTTAGVSAPPLRMAFAGYDLTWVVGRFQGVYFERAARGGSGPGTYTYSSLIRFPGDAAAFDADAVRILGTPTRPGVYEGSFIVRDQTQPEPQSASYPVRIAVVPAPAFSGATSFGPFPPGTTIPAGAALPALRGLQPGQTPRYVVAAGADRALRAVGLRIDGGELAGRVDPNLTQAQIAAGVRWTWTALVDPGGEAYDIECAVSFDRAAPTLPPQADLEFDEGEDVGLVRLSRASGGSGSFTYTLGNSAAIGTIGLRSDGTLFGAAPLVASDLVRRVSYTATDDVTGRRTNTVYFNLTIKDVVSPAGALVLPDYFYDAPNDAARSVTIPPARRATGALAAAATYAAVHRSGPAPPDVSFLSSGVAFIVARTDMATARDSLWTWTAASGAASDSALITIRIYGRFRYEPAAKRFTGRIRVPFATGFGERVVPAGGKQVGGGYASYRVKTQFPPASGLTAAVDRTGFVSISGAPLTAEADAVVEATDHPKSDGTRSTTDLAVSVVSAESPFCFAAPEYELEALEGAAVDWLVPEAYGGTTASVQIGNLAGGSLTEEITSDLLQPAPSADGWRVRGTVTARPGAYRYTLRAASAAGETCDADLSIIILPRRRTESFRTPCGIVVAQRNPRTGVLERSLRSTLPNMTPGAADEGIGAIKSFAPSAFIVDPKAMLTFSWTAVERYNGVQIPEIDLWQTDPELPVCGGQPNLRPVLSVGHDGDAALEVQAPSIPGVYPYRLEALRAGNSSLYLPADYWIVWVLVTEEPVARHVSINKTAVPEDFPVILQFAYRGEAPTGDQLLRATARYDPEAAALPAPQDRRNTGGAPGAGGGAGPGPDDEYCRQHPDDPACGGQGGAG